MTIIFWLLFALLLYPAVLFPLLLTFALMLRETRAPVLKIKNHPSVSLVIVAGNDALELEVKLGNALAQDYPCDKMEIAVAVPDNFPVPEKTRIFNKHPMIIKFFEFTRGESRGAVLNRIVPCLKGDIVVFTDLRARLNDQALQFLVRWFDDFRVGGATGKKMLETYNEAHQRIEIKNYSLEESLRELESNLATCFNNETLVFAIRRSLYRPIPPGVTGGLYAAMNLARMNYRVVYEPDARAFLTVSDDDPEMRLDRTRRVLCCTLNCMRAQADMLNPMRHAAVSFLLVSHHLYRVFVPFLLMAFLFGNLAVAGEGMFYRYFLLGQVVFYLIGLSLLALPRPWKREIRYFAGGFLYAPSCFLFENYAMLLGLRDFIKKEEYD